MEVRPFYSWKEKKVYHTCSKCTEGNNIERDYRSYGKGGLRKCKTCKRLELNGKC